MGSIQGELVLDDKFGVSFKAIAIQSASAGFWKSRPRNEKCSNSGTRRSAIGQLGIIDSKEQISASFFSAYSQCDAIPNLRISLLLYQCFLVIDTRTKGALQHCTTQSFLLTPLNDAAL